MKRLFLLKLSTLTAILLACSPLARRTLREPLPDAGISVRVWTADNVDVVARNDGWVEVIPAFQSSVGRARAGYLMPRERFSADQVSAWVNASRAFLTNAGGDAPKLGVWQIHLKNGGRGWMVAMNSDCIAGSLSAEGSVPPTQLLSVFDSAARVARALRPVPVAVDVNTPFDRRDVACEARVDQQVSLMTPVSRYSGSATFSETLARFVLAPNGLADTTTLQFIPSLAPDLEVAARHAIANRWFTSAMLAGRVVSQWVHMPVAFVDSGYLDKLEPLAHISGKNWSPRADGLVEWRDSADRQLHEVFSPTEILDWLSDFERLRATAPASAAAIRETITPSGTPPRNTSAWIQLLGARGENRIAANLFWSRGDSVPHVRIALSFAHCGSDSLRIIASDQNAVEQFMQAREAALLARQRRAIPSLDTTRIYGALEITCPAQRAGEAIASALQDESLRTSLNLPREALVHFTVDRHGSVERGSVQLFGEWNRGDTRRIAHAIEELQFEPARFAGHRVAQYVSHLVHAANTFAPGSHEIVREVCMTAPGAAARLRVLQPSEGGIRSRLEHLAQRIALAARNQRDTIPPSGVMRFVFSPESDLTFVRWISLPENPALGDRIRNSMPYWKFDPFTLESAPSYGIEARIEASCPPA